MNFYNNLNWGVSDVPLRLLYVILVPFVVMFVQMK